MTKKSIKQQLLFIFRSNCYYARAIAIIKVVIVIRNEVTTIERKITIA